MKFRNCYEPLAFDILSNLLAYADIWRFVNNILTSNWRPRILGLGQMSPLPPSYATGEVTVVSEMAIVQILSLLRSAISDNTFIKDYIADHKDARETGAHC